MSKRFERALITFSLGVRNLTSQFKEKRCVLCIRRLDLQQLGTAPVNPALEGCRDRLSAKGADCTLRSTQACDICLSLPGLTRRPSAPKYTTQFFIMGAEYSIVYLFYTSFIACRSSKRLGQFQAILTRTTTSIDVWVSL